MNFGILNFVRQQQFFFLVNDICHWRLSELIGLQTTCFSLMSCNLPKASFKIKTAKSEKFKTFLK